MEQFWGTRKGNLGVLSMVSLLLANSVILMGHGGQHGQAKGNLMHFTIPKILLRSYVQLRKAMCTQHAFCIFQYNAPIYMGHKDEKKRTGKNLADFLGEVGAAAQCCCWSCSCLLKILFPANCLLEGSSR